MSTILKLYNVIDEHKISNIVQQTTSFESETTKMESLCSNSHEREVQQPQQVIHDAKDSCIEPF